MDQLFFSCTCQPEDPRLRPLIRLLDQMLETQEKGIKKAKGARGAKGAKGCSPECSPGYTLHFTSLLFEFLFLLHREFSVPLSAADADRKSRGFSRLKPILDYIGQHYNEPLTLSGVAAQASLQPEYFCRFFKKTWA